MNRLHLNGGEETRPPLFFIERAMPTGRRPWRRMSRHIIRVLIADDHAQVRQGIRNLLSREEDIRVVGEAINGKEAIEMVASLAPDVLILDVEMPLLNGLQVVSRLREDKARVRVLALSAYNDPQYIRGMLESGASEYLTKDEVPTRLIPALRQAADNNQTYLKK